jgi:enamine deaminase RidA (YjgF/YER057c/UK114 family)
VAEPGQKQIVGTSRPGSSEAVKVGALVMLSGQVAIDGGGALVGAGDVRAQAEQCFANIERILGEAGSTLDDVVELTCFLTDPAHLTEYLEVRAARFPTRAPATTTVVARLALPELLIELKAVAVAADPTTS